MKTFTIDGNKQISVFASKKEAATASVTDAFTNQDEFAELTAEWPMQRLVEVWNGIPGVTRISKFTSRKVAAERIWKAIQSLEVPAKPEPSVPEADVPEAPTPEPAVTEAPPVTGVQPPVPVTEAAQPEPAAAVEIPQIPAQAEAPSSTVEAVADVGAQAPDVVPEAEQPKKRTTRAKKAHPTAPKAKTAKSDGAPREGSKTAQVVAMLQRKDGATITEIMDKMGWQKHTVRGFMAGAMKKAGYTVESFKPEGGERSYRINP